MDESWEVSGFTSRRCGSLYTTALVDKLTLVGTTNEPLIDPEGDDEITDEQNELLEDFTNAVYYYLVTNIDRKNPEHGLTFPATEEQQRITDQKEHSISNNGSNKDLIRTVSSTGAEYLHSYRGFDDSSDDGGLHNTIRRIQTGSETDMDTVIWAYRALKYRMTQMSIADTYLSMMAIPLPKGLLCHEYDTKNVRKDVGDEKHSILERLIFDRKNLFPRPIAAQGRPFYKGMDYMIATLHYADLPIDVVVRKLDKLDSILKQSLEREREEMLKRDAEVVAKRGKLFRSFSVAGLGDKLPA